MTTNFHGFGHSGIDDGIDARLSEHFERFNVSALDAVKLFPVLARRQWLKRFLAHTELFKLTIDVPGDIAEFGVFRGLGIMTFANLLEAYCIGDRTKVVYGFDNWRGFEGFTAEDGAASPEIQKTVGGFDPGSYKAELEDAIDIFDQDRFIPWKKRVKLIEGDIAITVPQFCEENPGVRFSLVNFDCDLYAPTKAALDAVWERVTRGGVVLFDEYAIKEWSGETKAVDEFLEAHPGLRVRTFPWTNTPAGYLVKP
jgi:hypothetical protein